MKIAIPSTAPSLKGNIEQRIGMAAYFLIIETEDLRFSVLERQPESNRPGAGIEAITEVLNMGAEVLLVDFIAPHIAEVIRSSGVTVIDRIQGPVEDALQSYITSLQQSDSIKKKDQPAAMPSWSESIQKALKQFRSLLPILIGVIMLIGLFQGFVSQQALLAFFSGAPIPDSLLGASLGSILAGNPVNSYVIGDNLLKAGIGIAPVAALMLTWVSVGIIQIPAEAAALGLRFALIRAAAGFAAAIIMALAVACLMGVVV